MLRTTAMAALISAFVSITSLAPGQVRVTPAEAKGDQEQGEPWANVPDSFRKIRIPDWPLPVDLARWQQVDRVASRARGMTDNKSSPHDFVRNNSRSTADFFDTLLSLNVTRQLNNRFHATA